MPMLAMTDARTNPFGKVSAQIDIMLQMKTYRWNSECEAPTNTRRQKAAEI